MCNNPLFWGCKIHIVSSHCTKLRIVICKTISYFQHFKRLFYWPLLAAFSFLKARNCSFNFLLSSKLAFRFKAFSSLKQRSNFIFKSVHSPKNFAIGCSIWHFWNCSIISAHIGCLCNVKGGCIFRQPNQSAIPSLALQPRHCYVPFTVPNSIAVVLLNCVAG